MSGLILKFELELLPFDSSSDWHAHHASLFSVCLLQVVSDLLCSSKSATDSPPSLNFVFDAPLLQLCHSLDHSGDVPERDQVPEHHVTFLRRTLTIF